MYKQVIYNVLAAKVYVMVHGLNIKKWYWERYQFIQTKSDQYQYYGRGGMGRYEIGKDKIGKYKQLTTFKKSCSCCDIGNHENVTWECNARIWYKNVMLEMW